MELWNKCIDLLRAELDPQVFSTWLLPLQPHHPREDHLVLYAPNPYVQEWVRQNYLEKLLTVAGHLSHGSVTRVSVEVGSAPRMGDYSPTLAPSAPARVADERDNQTINPEFTFESFVQGKSNQLARAASIHVADFPGTANNPLFIYGGVGLGKTHLMHAIGNQILRRNPGARVLYLRSENFVAEMVKGLQNNLIDEFKRRVRSVNALFIDDVQFFAGKERSQEEFFHTFNALFESGQQIVLSSDRFPKEVKGLEERLISRLGCGLTVAIDPPDFETRVAILQSKAEHLFHIQLPENVAFFIGKKIRSNIRELEGALRRVMANAKFTGRTIDVEFAKESLKDMLAAHNRTVTIGEIKKAAAEYFHIRLADLDSAKRNRTLARPRQIAMALAKELTNHSLPEIGQEFGGRDHTTVLYASKKVAEMREADSKFDEDYRNLLRTLSN